MTDDSVGDAHGISLVDSWIHSISWHRSRSKIGDDMSVTDDMSAIFRRHSQLRSERSLSMQRQQVLLCTIQQVLFCDRGDPREVSQCKHNDSKCCSINISKCCSVIRMIREKSLDAKTASAALYTISASAVLWSGWSERNISMQTQRTRTSTINYILGYKGKWYMPHQWLSRWTQEQSWGPGWLGQVTVE